MSLMYQNNILSPIQNADVHVTCFYKISDIRVCIIIKTIESCHCTIQSLKILSNDE